MEKGNVLIYDGTLDGFFTLAFTAFEQKMQVTAIYTEAGIQQDFFSQPEVVITDFEKAQRVKAGMAKNISAKGRRALYFSFLSEQTGIELLMLHYIQQAFKKENFSETDYGDPVVLKVSQVAKMVSREKHRMEAFVRFMLTKDNIYFAHIEPDFNVLPLILPHFESRYADQKWIIYDLNRKYGLYYNLHTTNYITLDLPGDIMDGKNKTFFDPSEIGFQQLWQQYFKSTNIKSRKNMRLHLQHVPKRYWKLLTEKSALPN